MRKTIIILLIITIVLAIVSGCGSGSGMHQTKLKTRGGLARQVPQVDDYSKGQSLIVFTEEMKYPGMTPYEDSKYDFVSADPPEKVARWFEANLKDSTVNRRTGQRAEDVKFEITWEQYIIDVVAGPNGSDSLIRYKRNLKLLKK